MKNFLIIGLFAALANTATFAMLQPKQAPCTDGRTPLMLAILNGKSITESLIQDNINSLNQQDDFGRTALHYAALNNSKITIALLVKYKTDRTLKDHAGMTAEDITREQQKIIARSESHSYEHRDYLETSTPVTTDPIKPEISIMHRPNKPVNLGDETQEDSSSPNVFPDWKKNNPGYPSYADLI